MGTFSLGDGSDTVVFANDANANGVDEIKLFTAGASGNFDKLDFGGTTGFLTKAALANVTAVDLQDGSTNTLDLDTTTNNVGIIKNHSGALLTTEITAAGNANSIKVGDGKTAVVLVTTATDTSVAATYDVYYVTGGVTNAASVDLVGHVSADVAFNAGNFA